MYGGNIAAVASLNATNFWEGQWQPGWNCTVCGAAASSRACNPGGFTSPPKPLRSFVGTYGSPQGGRALALSSSERDGLTLTQGPLNQARLHFSKTSTVLVDEPCATVAAVLSSQLMPWAPVSKLAALPGACTHAKVHTHMHVDSLQGSVH